MISLIVAHDQNRVIGANNDLPWYIPEELKYFKRMTINKPVIMGRKTFESIGKALPKRRNIVVTRNKSYKADDIETVPNVEAALALVANEPEVMVIGGAKIFEIVLPVADRLYITYIDYSFEGDTYFPKYDNFTLVSKEEPITAPDGYTYQYMIFEKKR